MPATALPTSTRFITPGNTGCLFAPANGIAATNFTPTSAELTATAVKILTGELADWSGWSVSSTQVQTPDLVSDFVPTIPGRSQAEDSSLTFYADKAGVDASTIFQRDLKGFIVFGDDGFVAAKKVDVFPVRVTSVSKQRGSVDGTAASKVLVQFSIYTQPAIGVAVGA